MFCDPNTNGLGGTIASNLVQSKRVLEVYISINAMNKLGEIVGAGSGALLQLGTGAV